MAYPKHGLSKKAEMSVHREVAGILTIAPCEFAPHCVLRRGHTGLHSPTKRLLKLVTVTIKGGRWAVYDNGKRISTYFAKGREALNHACDQGWQVGYRGLTYNDGGYLNGVRAEVE